MILLQIQSAADSTAAVTAAEGIHVIDLIMKGGWVMIPLFILLGLTLYLIIERWIAINSNGKLEASFIDNIKDFIRQGNVKSAESLCRNQHSAAGRVFEKAVGLPDKILDVVNKTCVQFAIYIYRSPAFND